MTDKKQKPPVEKPQAKKEETFLDRLQKERSDLSEKVTKLHAFLQTQQFQGLDTTNRTLLKKQLVFMSEYLGILDQRAALLCNTKQ